MKNITIQFIHKLFCFCACALTILAANAAITRGQTTEDGYDPNANVTVNVVTVQPDGKSLAAGRFTNIGGGAQSNLARLKSDGTLDAAFAPTIDVDVAAIVLQSDNKILIGGTFTTVNGQTQPRLARLNADGTLDAWFNPAVDNRVSAIAVQPDGKILIVGLFTQVGGQTRNRVARLNADGTLDAGFNPNADNSTAGLVLQPDGKIVIGGGFSNVGGVPRSRIARLNQDGSVDQAFNPNADNIVSYLALQADGKILAGGLFTNIGGVAKQNLARLNRDGTVDNSFQGLTSARIRDIKIAPDGKILIGGADIEAPGLSNLRRIIRLNRTDGSVDTNFVANFNNSNGIGVFVNAIAVQPDNKIVVGGAFTDYQATQSNGTVNYTNSRSNIARLELDGNLDKQLSLSGTFNNYATLVQPDGKFVLAGGSGTTNFPYSVKRGTAAGLDANFNVIVNDIPYALALQPDGKILVGGGFTQINSQTRNALARLNADGSVDSTFNSNFVNAGATAIIYAVVVQADGKILAGGSFTSINGLTRSGIVRLNANGTLDTAFRADTDGAVRSILVQNDGKIVIGGDFTSINGATRTRIARLDAANGAADAFNPTIDARVNAVTVQSDGKIIAGGEFSTANGATRTRIARFNSDGTLDANFNAFVAGFLGRTNYITSLALQADKKIIIAGRFFRLSNVPNEFSTNLGRLNTDGSADTTFKFGDLDDTEVVQSITLQADGKILTAAPNRLFLRVSNPTAAVQTLSATRSDVFWNRALAKARLDRATFEVSADNGATYTALGGGTRVGATESFFLSNLNLPINQNILIRARGFYLEASNGGTQSIVESIRNFYFAVPTAANDAYSTNEDTPLTVAATGVLANDTTASGSSLTAILVTQPTNGTVALNADGSFVYTPNANFNGADSFTYKANNGENDSNTATVNITVNADNDPPIAVDDQYSTKNSLTLNVPAPGVLANDIDAENSPLTAVLVGGTTNGTLNFNANGSFTYKAFPNFVGTDSFTYQANDGALNSNTATVTITVTAPISRTVTKTADTDDGACDADCSLREAIAAAEAGDTVNFSALFDQPQTITLSDNLKNLTISKSLTIAGKGANRLTVQRQAGASRYNLFFIPQGNITATISGMTLTNGFGGGSGGAILNNANLIVNKCQIIGNTASGTGGGIANFGTLTVNNSTIANNSAPATQFGGAGGIFNQGTLTMTNSTVSGNVVTGDVQRGGGIYTNSSSVSIVNSTITDNNADGANSAGGIYRQSGTVTIRNSIIAANRNNSSVPDVAGSFNSSGYNLIGSVGAATGFGQTGDQTGTLSAPLDPRISILNDFGGTTLTHALFSNSPAVDRADPNNSPAFDQRNIFRGIGGRADIGAYELNFTFSNNPNGSGGSGTLPNGATGQSYSVQISATRNDVPPSRPFENERLNQTESPAAPLTYSVIAGSLPNGLTLDPASGTISGTPTQAGTFNFTIKATDTDGIGGAQSYTITIFGPTAASVSIGGQILTPDGRGLTNARVVLTDASGNTRTMTSSSFGYYRFDDVAAGETVVISIISRRYTFAPQVISVTEDLTGLNFTAIQ